MDALLRWLGRSGLRRGLSGGHWAWLVVAGASFLLRRTRRPDDASATINLAPGERYLVRLVEAGRRTGPSGGGDAGDGGGGVAPAGGGPAVAGDPVSGSRP
ncbi:MAG: hypothetical protein ACRDY3_11100 [Acidimicrobiales bacterium]